jgi:hypothetical protein
MVWTFMKRKQHRRYGHAVSFDNASSFSDSEISVDDYPSASAKPKVTPKSANEAKSKRGQHVTFSDVQTRHYRRILGDNPYAVVPLSLGWEIEGVTQETVDEHEARVSQSRDYRLAQKIQRLERDNREALLRRAGYSKDQVQLEERRRRAVMLLEWTYRQNRDECVVYGCEHGMMLFKRYIM